MRAVQTFVVKLFVESGDPRRVRGSVQALPEGESEPFTDGASLLSLLRRLSLQSLPGVAVGNGEMPVEK